MFASVSTQYTETDGHAAAVNGIYNPNKTCRLFKVELYYNIHLPVKPPNVVHRTSKCFLMMLWKQD